ANASASSTRRPTRRGSGAWISATRTATTATGTARTSRQRAERCLQRRGRREAALLVLPRINVCARQAERDANRIRREASRCAAPALRRSGADTRRDVVPGRQHVGAVLRLADYLLHRNDVQPVPKPSSPEPRLDLAAVLPAEIVAWIAAAKRLVFNAVGDTDAAKVDRSQSMRRRAP